MTFLGNKITIRSEALTTIAPGDIQITSLLAYFDYIFLGNKIIILSVALTTFTPDYVVPGIF